MNNSIRTYKAHIAAYILIFLVLSLALGIKLLPLAISEKFVFIAVFCILLFSAATAYALIYLVAGSNPVDGGQEGVVRKYRYEIALAMIIGITTLPLLTESFFYYDDWWDIGTRALLSPQSLITFARPIHNLTFAVLDSVWIRNAYLLRWAVLPAVIIYAIVLFRWFCSKTLDKNHSFLLACVLSVFAPVIDTLGYGSIAPFFYAISFSALSVICFERAYLCFLQKEKIKLLANAAFAFNMLFVALLTYQIGTQIVFVLLTIALYYNVQKKSLWKFNIAYLIFFGIANGTYLLFLKLLRWMYHIEAWRSQTIGSLSELVDKINFFKAVLIQCMMQVEAAVTGGRLFDERYHGYFITFTNQSLGNLLLIIVLVMIVIAFVNYILRTRSVLGLLSLFAFIPMSYFVFLILSESGYLTYYAFALIGLLMFYFLAGLIAFARFVWMMMNRISLKIGTIATNNLKPAYLILPILVVCALNSNYYARDFYINYNNDVYNFIKYSIQTAIETEDIKRVHLYGIISPINADVYSRFITETALKDLGENVGGYTITFSRNRYFLMRMEEADYDRIYDQIPKEEQIILDRLYAFDETYRQYNLKAWPLEEDQKKLQQIFISAEVIPQASSSNTLIIDITWTDRTYYLNPR